MWADENKTPEQSNHLSFYKKSDYADIIYTYMHLNMFLLHNSESFYKTDPHQKYWNPIVVGIISQQKTLPVSA